MSIFGRLRKKDDAVIVDSVTGTFNRRQLDRDIAQGGVSDQPTSTLMIDVDDFDRYTGKKGAPDPDQVLERVHDWWKGIAADHGLPAGSSAEVFRVVDTR